MTPTCPIHQEQGKTREHVGVVQQQRGEEGDWGECQAPGTLYSVKQRSKVLEELLAAPVARILEMDQIGVDRAKIREWLLWLATKLKNH